jgi:hypothetical protein
VEVADVYRKQCAIRSAKILSKPGKNLSDFRFDFEKDVG